MVYVCIHLGLARMPLAISTPGFEGHSQHKLLLHTHTTTCNLGLKMVTSHNHFSFWSRGCVHFTCDSHKSHSLANWVVLGVVGRVQ